jgi:hypothetical protein
MHIAAARIACALAYPLLAHWASHDGRGWVAALALADLALVILIEPLLHRRGWAWGVFVLLLAACGRWRGRPMRTCCCWPRRCCSSAWWRGSSAAACARRASR